MRGYKERSKENKKASESWFAVQGHNLVKTTGCFTPIHLGFPFIALIAMEITYR